MPTPMLALNTLDGTTPQVRRYLGATVVTQGNTFGALDTGFGGTVGTQKILNRIIQFGNASTLVATTGAGIYRSTDSGSSWSLVHTFSPAILADQTLKTGIHQVTLNGIPTLIMAYCDNGGTWRGVTSTNGFTWTNNGSVGGTTTGNPGPYSEIVYRNKLYWCVRFSAGTNGRIMVYDPGASALSSFEASPAMKTGGSGQDQSGASLIEWNGNLYIFYNSASETLLLSLVLGNTTSTVVNFGTFGGQSTESGLSACFIDGNNFYGFIAFHGTTGLRAFQATPSFVGSTITNTVLPAGVSGTTNQVRCYAHVDGEATIGSDPNKYLYLNLSAGSSGAYSLFKWNGNSTVMSLIDIGGNTTHALSRTTNTTGSVFFTSGANTVEIISRAAVSGGLRFSFKLYSSSGAATVSVTGYYGTSTDEYDITEATLVSPSSGIMSGNVITSLTADNGVTTYQVTWNSLSDGITPGDYYRFVFSISA